MATQTLVEAKKHFQDDLVVGVAEDIISVNPIMGVLPFDGFTGQSVTVNHEAVLGDAAFYGVGDTITSKAASQVTPVTFFPTKIIGDAEVDGLVQATSGSAGEDTMVTEIRSKAKNVSRQFQSGMALGDGVGNNMSSLSVLNFDAQQSLASSALGGAALVDDLDALMDLVLAKDGEVDFIAASPAVIRLYRSYLRGLGGETSERVTLASGKQIIGFNGTPIFRNDFLPTNLGAGTNETEVFAGCFDDGTRKIGIAGIAPEANMGIQVQSIGASETKDEEITRIKWYANMANFNRRGLAKLTGVIA